MRPAYPNARAALPAPITARSGVNPDTISVMWLTETADNEARWVVRSHAAVTDV
jgi:hypothetical protein